MPTEATVAHIVVAKYADHLPLYRQEQIYAQRHGLNLPRQTLARWVASCARTGRLAPTRRASSLPFRLNLRR